MFSFWLLSNAFYNWKNIYIFLQGFIILNNFFCIFFFWCCGGVDKTRFSIYLLYERGFAIYSIIFSLISLLLKSILRSFQFDWCYSLFIGFMMILVLKYTLIVFRSNWWCPAGVKSILINKVVVYLRLISYMPDKLVAILFYWSLNAKSSKFLLSSTVCDFQPKHGLKQLMLKECWISNRNA